MVVMGFRRIALAQGFLAQPSALPLATAYTSPHRAEPEDDAPPADRPAPPAAGRCMPWHE